MAGDCGTPTYSTTRGELCGGIETTEAGTEFQSFQVATIDIVWR